jgi:pimeloyl-ACP methyl ester carboxylesterase
VPLRRCPSRWDAVCFFRGHYGGLTVKVHYKVFGQGRPFITISGAPGDHRIILSWMEPIFRARPGWKRFYFDLPGTGCTPGEGWITGKEQILDVICDFIEAVIPGQPFTLLGLSAGGYYARGVVYRKEALVEGLCLLVPWLGPHESQELPSPVAFVKDTALTSQLTPDDAERFEKLMVVQNQRILDWYRDVVIPASKDADWQFLDRVLANYKFSFDVDERPFEKPTLIVTGRQDTHVGYLGAWNVLESYPRGTFVVLDRAGHALGIEQEALFHALVNEWLDRVEEYAVEQRTS